MQMMQMTNRKKNPTKMIEVKEIEFKKKPQKKRSKKEKMDDDEAFLEACIAENK